MEWLVKDWMNLQKKGVGQRRSGLIEAREPITLEAFKPGRGQLNTVQCTWVKKPWWDEADLESNMNTTCLHIAGHLIPLLWRIWNENHREVRKKEGYHPMGVNQSNILPLLAFLKDSPHTPWKWIYFSVFDKGAETYLPLSFIRSS